MAFAVICKSCQARFLLNDDLLRRKVAGKVVTVRCRQCHATIEVDASDVDPKKLAEVDKAPPPPPPPVQATLTQVKPKAARPAPSPPRPAAKSTLMGIGAPRPVGATELVALSPGLLNVGTATKLAPQGFPEPPPPPPAAGAIETLDSDDWEIADTPALAAVEAPPESVDDFMEELPPSVPPEEELPSSTGTPSLKALTHHDETAQPHRDDFLANMTAAMNGGIMMGAPTIDVSDLSPAAPGVEPSIDMSAFDIPLEGKKTLPLFGVDEESDASTLPPPVTKPGPTGTSPLLVAPAAATAPARRSATAPLSDGSLSATTHEPKPPVSERPDTPRSRRNVIAPATKSVPPPAPERQRSTLAAPLLLAVAAAAGFLIWKRAAPASGDSLALVEREAPQQAAPAAPEPVAAAAPAVSVAGTPPPAPALADDDMTFETVKTPPAPATQGGPSTAREPTAATPTPGASPQTEPQAEAKPEPKSAPTEVTEAPKAEPRPAREPSAEPSGPFDRAAASAALTTSAAQASGCRKDGDPSGVASVVVTFAPSGRVTSANISGPPFAGTPTGGCIAGALRKARIPAFEGERVTVSKTVVIQ
jgi:predicted Zn finger-like uncharacterized protein